jgi:SulP family sulfate permease
MDDGMPVKVKQGKVYDSGERTTAILKLDLLRTYKREWFLGDFTAGLVIFLTTIPAALAYGHLAGLQPINGLYASLLAMGVYAFFGTSRQLIIDAEAAVAILVATSVASVYSGGDPVRFATLAMLEAIMVGVMQVLAGVGRLGFVSEFIPKSVVTGFINGVALVIILAQAGRFSGIELKNEAFIPRIWELAARAHEAHLLTLYIGVACLLVMLIMRPLLRRVPEAVVVMVLATLAVMKWDLGAQGVNLVGAVPAGLPHPLIPNVGFSDILTMLPVAAGVALVSFLDTSITGRAFAMRGGYRLEPNQELVALGLANMGTGFFQGFAIGSSHSRTAINEMSGGRSQFAGLLAAIFLGVFLVYFTGILKSVPTVALSAVIIVAGISLMNPRELIRIFHIRPASAYMSLVTTAAVLIAGLMIGILVSVALAIILVLHRLARPHETIIRTPKMEGLLVYRFAGPLYFFNAAYFANRVQELIDSNDPPVTVFMINAEAIVDMDWNAAEILGELHDSLKSQGIVLGVYDAKGDFQKILKNTRLTTRTGFNLYPSLAAGLVELSKMPAKEAEKVSDQISGS